MKLRFRQNSLRLRVNQREVETLAAGRELRESLTFSGGTSLEYVLANRTNNPGSAEFDGKVIRVTAPLSDWAHSSEIGLYFVAEPGLRVAIEKDLECLDGPPEEKDPHAYPRSTKDC